MITPAARPETTAPNMPQLIQPVLEGKSYEPIAIIRRDKHTIEYDFGTTIGGYWEIEMEANEREVLWEQFEEKFK